MLEDERDEYKLSVTLQDFSQLPSIYFRDCSDDRAETWLTFLSSHPEVIAVQIAKNGEIQPNLVWAKDGLSLPELLKAFKERRYGE